ncbi:MAG TPA: F0F1 ATP synthase subunit B [Acidimicrobiia bacterium]|nr:F0F1 ATP synthase subunit B [Acidimicrobiia bacterium]
MRTRTLLAGGLLAATLVVAVPTPALAADPGTTAGKDLVECVKKALNDNQSTIGKQQYTDFTNALDNCRKAKSLFTPALPELIWGAIAFMIVAAALMKYAFPAMKKGLKAREEKIRGDLEAAERAREEAEDSRREYERRLTEARAEATQLIEAAHQDAERVRQDLLQRAETDAHDLRTRAQDDIRAATDRALADLRTRVTDLSVELAERIVGHNLDRDTQLALVDSYIDSVGAGGNGN